jgi:hypothetical protein
LAIKSSVTADSAGTPVTVQPESESGARAAVMVTAAAVGPPAGPPGRGRTVMAAVMVTA